MEEFTSLFGVNVTCRALNTFINVIIGIGVVIGFAVVWLSMYMAVLQRTREIGILKSLGGIEGLHSENHSGGGADLGTRRHDPRHSR